MDIDKWKAQLKEIDWDAVKHRIEENLILVNVYSFNSKEVRFMKHKTGSNRLFLGTVTATPLLKEPLHAEIYAQGNVTKDNLKGKKVLVGDFGWVEIKSVLQKNQQKKMKFLLTLSITYFVLYVLWRIADATKEMKEIHVFFWSIVVGIVTILAITSLLNEDTHGKL